MHIFILNARVDLGPKANVDIILAFLSHRASHVDHRIKTIVSVLFVKSLSFQDCGEVNLKGKGVF